MIVIDASVLVDLLVGRGAALDRITGEELAAPHLVDAEVGSALRRMTLVGDLDRALAEHAFEDLLSLEISRFAHPELLLAAWALRDNLTMYDALYLVLAEALGSPLVTLDNRLAGVAGARGIVEVIAP